MCRCNLPFLELQSYFLRKSLEMHTLHIQFLLVRYYYTRKGAKIECVHVYKYDILQEEIIEIEVDKMNEGEISRWKRIIY